MTGQDELLWHLRIYGPCGIRRLIETTAWKRERVNGAMTRLRQKHLVARTEHARYQVTEDGLAALELLRPSFPFMDSAG